MRIVYWQTISGNINPNFFRKLGKMLQNLQPAAFAIAALKVNPFNSLPLGNFFPAFLSSADFFSKLFFEKFFQEYYQSVKQF